MDRHNIKTKTNYRQKLQEENNNTENVKRQTKTNRGKKEHDN
jgi:hypothetical protein